MLRDHELMSLYRKCATTRRELVNTSTNEEETEIRTALATTMKWVEKRLTGHTGEGVYLNKSYLQEMGLAWTDADEAAEQRATATAKAPPSEA